MHENYKVMKNAGLIISRSLLFIGLVIGLKSWWMTIAHVGDESYQLVSEFTKGSYHAWYHAFRESIGDLAVIATLLLIFFGSKNWRTPKTWWVAFILMVGYYAPFWIGVPFYSQLGAPNIGAEIVHLAMAVPPIVALFLARKYFYQNIAKLK